MQKNNTAKRQMNKKNSHEQTDIENNNTKRNDIDRDQIEKNGSGGADGSRDRDVSAVSK